MLEVLNNERIMLPISLYPSLALDDVQCFTDYEPRSIPESSLVKQAVGGITTTTSRGYHIIDHVINVDSLFSRVETDNIRELSGIFFGSEKYFSGLQGLQAFAVRQS